MPDVQEVFRMATQKVDQEPGAHERLVVRRRKADRNRQLAAIVTVLIFAAIAAAAFALVRSDKSRPATPPARIPVGDASGKMLDLGTGKTMPLPANIATSGDTA
jgi:hypothetical protein